MITQNFDYLFIGDPVFVIINCGEKMIQKIQSSKIGTGMLEDENVYVN